MHQSSRPSALSALSAQPAFAAALRLTMVASLLAAALCASQPVRAAVATATSTSTVVAPIAVARGADLTFGKFAATAPGTVIISTSGARTATGGIVLIAGATNTAARFDVSGGDGATYSIALGGTAVLTSPASDTMGFTPISDLTAGGATSGNVSSGTLTGGAQSIYVGGILNVIAAQPAGLYSGTVTATVEYN